MKTTYFKSDNLYEVRLAVRKINVEFVGNDNYPFCCNIITQDDKYLRCAVGIADIPQFILAEENDVLVLTLASIYKKSMVMGVQSCQNLIHQWVDFCAEQIASTKNGFFTTEIKLAKAFEGVLLHASNRFEADTHYYLLTQNPNQYIFFFTNEYRLNPEILGAKEGDVLEVAFKNFDILDVDVFKNKSRNIEALNPLIHFL